MAVNWVHEFWLLLCAYSTAHLNNELWEIENNKYDWELRYLHPNYSQSLEENATIRQPCPGKLHR